MLRTLELPNASGFSIWFNKKEKKEYYITPLTGKQIKLTKDIVTKRNQVLLKSDFENFSSLNCNLYLFNYLMPLEEKYGTFLIRFLNADFTSALTAYKTFFCFYGLELLKDYSKQIPSLFSKVSEIEYYSTYISVFDKNKEKIIEFQNTIKDCVNYMYNLNGDEKAKEYPAQIKFISFALQQELYKYTTKTTIYFNNLFAFDGNVKGTYQASPAKITRKIKEGTLDYKTSNIYHSSSLTNSIFIALNEIAMNNTAIIKTCQNCGKYFIPTSKESEIYCDNVYFVDEKPCRVTGAAETFKKNIGELEGYKLYKKTYQRITMQIARGKINPYSTKYKYFCVWKQTAQNYMKNFKKGKLKAEDFNYWVSESVKKFDNLDEK